MKKLVIKFYMWYTGLTEDQLAARYEMNMMLYKNKFKAYWYTLVDKS